ncbi:hypothetical protein O7598_18670 [Micromonospora sp. WMMC241]|uniref:hypothetical protein n=1 Tax=Micromonospora sp. WMMC241 TaxID=3015159 RepID=UPI0022B6519A|nr:hypothetical protein [Micromonospora sp. WMMC241]MCZ7438439.1 hypothetical protein [Micromonospora sp. WMMC241]
MKRQLTTTAVVAVAAVAAALVGAAPAYAVNTCTTPTPCPTTVTFDITAGTLTITVPETASLTTQAPSGTPQTRWAFGPLGSVTVNDTRASGTDNWVVTVTGTAFTHSGASPAIPTTDVYYCSGDATSVSGVGTFTPGQPSPCTAPPPADGDAVSTTPTAFTHTLGVGANSATWDPSLSVQIPLSATVGTYTGTISHIVA